MAIRWAILAVFLSNIGFGLSYPAWDFEHVYKYSSDIFIGNVKKIETGLEYDTGFTGLYGEDKEAAKVVWTDVAKFTVNITESLKGKVSGTVELINVGGSQAVVLTDNNSNKKRIEERGPSFGIPRPKLSENEAYLFFVSLRAEGIPTKINWRNVFTVDHKKDEIAALRLIKQDPSIGTVTLAQEQVLGNLTEELQGRLFDILNQNPELTERREQLLNFIKSLGFVELWNSQKAQPFKRSKVGTIKVQIWDQASQEIVKIDMILEAQQKQNSNLKKSD